MTTKENKTWKIGDRIMMMDDEKMGIVTGISSGWTPQIYRVSLDNGIRLWVNNIDNLNDDANFRQARRVDSEIEFNPSERCSR